MRVPEVLAPAGGPAAFAAAIAGGADAVYCGLGNDFNARRGADNFDDESFSAACRMAHLAGSRVYLTENVAIQAKEMPAALALMARAARLGVDGFIIQDWGLLAEALRRFPQIEAHVSTQANIHDARAAAWLADKGVERVTLSRELSLPEIARIAETGVDCEVFAHGALCFCYSGLCMMSAMRGPRSANRGLCAQPCRLPHELVTKDGERVGPVAWERGLCPKDANMTGHLLALSEANVAALKIEGRMKAPDYVLAAVSSYREALDETLDRGEEGVSDEVARRLKRTFNRDFTDAYLRGESGNEMMSYERSNNRGELVGEVVSCSGREAKIRTDAPLGESDLLELRPIERPDRFLTAPCPRDVPAGGVVICPVKRFVPAGTPVRVLRSQAALDAAAQVVNLEAPRKRPARVHVICRLGEPLVVELTALPTLHGEEVTAWAKGPVVEAARTRPLTEADIVEHVGRMGATPFSAESFDVELDDGCGMGFSTLHRVRNAAVEALEKAVLMPFEQRAASVEDAPTARAYRAGVAALREDCGLPEPAAPVASAPVADLADKAEVRALVSTPEAARAALGAGATTVYATVDALDEHDGWPEGTVPLLDEVCREADHARLDRWVREGEACAAGSLSELVLAQRRGARAEVRGCVPVHNPSATAALEVAGATAFWLSPELTIDQAALVSASAAVPCGLVVWGHTRAMTSEHCVLQMADKCLKEATGDKDACRRCRLRRRDLYLENIDGRRLPVRTDVHGRSRIWWSEPLDGVPLLDRILAAGIAWLGVDCTLLDAEGTAEQVGRVEAARRALVGGRPLPAQQPGSTQGHLLKKVD